ncbi:hypothetical protein [Rufibacter roseus]|uniref:Uncharacterized protein n=1 Tax=Rufibacter roseus TaxID=1567108 RepID=A0ABW2DPC3_9BACT|nr:hypothetical protein [Rufibacter roseus]
MLLSIHIPVKPHVKKFLVAKYGGIYKLCMRDHIGVTLFNMLRRPKAKAREIERVKKFTQRYTVSIPEHFITDLGCKNLDGETLVQFNSLVEDFLLTCFHEFVENMEACGMEQRHAIAYFMAKYEFDETDVKYDALKKSYQRYRTTQREAGVPKPEGVIMLPFLVFLKTLSATSRTKELIKNVA